MCTGEEALQRAGLHHRAMSAVGITFCSGNDRYSAIPPSQRKPSTRMFWQALAYGERRSDRRKGKGRCRRSAPARARIRQAQAPPAASQRRRS